MKLSIAQGHDGALWSSTRVGARLTERPSLQSYLLLTWMVYVMLLQIMLNFSVFAEVSVLKKLEEILLVFLFPSALRGFRRLLGAGTWAKMFLAGISGYLVLGVVSWVGSELSGRALLMQFLIEMKLPIIITVFWGVERPAWLFRRFVLILKIILIVSIPVIFLQMEWPWVYNAIFTASDALKSHLWISPKIGLTRASGVFPHSSPFAFVCSILSIVLFIRAWEAKKRQTLIWFLVSFVLLLATLQRQEIVSVLLVLVFVFLSKHRSRAAGEKIAVGIIIATLCTIIILPVLPAIIQYTQHVVDRFNFSELMSAQPARALLYREGFQLAWNHFPFGVGFGGFGGQAARVFDSPYYDYVGFTDLWWYRRDLYLTDTFWPHVYAEAGLPGFTCYIVALSALGFGLRQAVKVNRGLSYQYFSSACAFSYVFLLLVSVTHSSFMTTLPLMMTFMFFFMPRYRGPAVSRARTN